MSKPESPEHHEDMHPPSGSGGGAASKQQRRSVLAGSSERTAKWKSFSRRAEPAREGDIGDIGEHAKWSLGVLNDKKAAEVPGRSLEFVPLIFDCHDANTKAAGFDPSRIGPPAPIIDPAAATWPSSPTCQDIVVIAALSAEPRRSEILLCRQQEKDCQRENNPRSSAR